MKIFIVALFLLLFSFNIVVAATCTTDDCSSGCTCATGSCNSSKVCTVADATNNNGGNTVTLPNPLGTSVTSIPQLIGKIIKAVLGIIGSLALAMFTYGGFRFLTSAGEADGVKVEKDTLIWATIGSVVVFSAYALVKFVFTGLGV